MGRGGEESKGGALHRDVSSGTPLSSESHPQWMLSCLMGNTQPPVRAPPGPPPEVTVSGHRVPSSCPPPYPPPTSLSLHFLLPISEAFQRGTRAIPFPVPIPIPIPIPSPSQSLGCGPGDLEAGEVVCIPPCVIPAPLLPPHPPSQNGTPDPKLETAGPMLGSHFPPAWVRSGACGASPPSCGTAPQGMESIDQC